MRRVGMNRGKPRIWIEGKILTEAGFKPGDRYDFDGTRITRNPEGKRKISGKGDRPIVDISGRAVPEGMTHFEQIIEGDGVLIIKKAIPE